MKIIDLLNKIANDEEVPKKIKYDDREFKFIGGAYEDKERKDLAYYDFTCWRFLNDEVEILEEENKTPEKLPSICACSDFNENEEKLAENINILKNKYNEIIDYLDYLKSKGE